MRNSLYKCSTKLEHTSLLIRDISLRNLVYTRDIYVYPDVTCYYLFNLEQSFVCADIRELYISLEYRIHAYCLCGMSLYLVLTHLEKHDHNHEQSFDNYVSKDWILWRVLHVKTFFVCLFTLSSGNNDVW